MKKTARAIIVDKNGLLVLYRRKKVNNEYIEYYAIPGGHMENGETLEETAIRELKEELNIDIKIIKYLGHMVMDEKRDDYYFSAKIIKGVPVLGGEELERNSEDNYYEFRYLPIDKLDDSGILSTSYVKEVINYGE